MGALSLWERACRVLPGGVSSPVRAFKGVGGEPLFIRAARGAWLEGEDGGRYVDYIGGYGPMILGHRHPAVEEAVIGAVQRGMLFGAPTAAEVDLAERICSAVPSVEMVRLVSSGTEATMSALRLARAATGRSKLVKLGGCYHGHGDSFLVAAGSGAATLGVPSSPGVPQAVTDDTLVAPYNGIAEVEELFVRFGGDIAAVFVEPIAGNMGLVLPRPRFLERLRELCTEHGALLVCDEVMTGFRVAWGGAQSLLRIEPDLTTLGKIIGGGLAIGAYGGRRELMERIAPAGPVYQAGTLAGNPLAVAAGLATLGELAADDFAVYRRLEETSAELERGIRGAAERHGVAVQVHRQGSMLGLFLTDQPVWDLHDVEAADRGAFARLFHHLLRRGVHLPPSAFEALFVSAAHGREEVDQTLDAFDHAFAAL
ncbi:MAG TPA: glutamate-1-semialdehyde 2,1-aminomutase [Thermoanaerobaculia bacterium]|nr:glutamate-1-semialdehyde 2,1-aminomutase [Thermoanaerobaculia bacterium]